MGFHKRHITNEYVIKLFKESEISKLIELYTGSAESVITEHGISSSILEVLNTAKKEKWTISMIENSVTTRLHKELQS
jgi:hypothetical protein